jgi:hypothetical protein
MVIQNLNLLWETSVVNLCIVLERYWVLSTLDNRAVSFNNEVQAWWHCYDHNVASSSASYWKSWTFSVLRTWYLAQVGLYFWSLFFIWGDKWKNVPRHLSIVELRFLFLACQLKLYVTMEIYRQKKVSLNKESNYYINRRLFNYECLICISCYNCCHSNAVKGMSALWFALLTIRPLHPTSG